MVYSRTCQYAVWALLELAREQGSDGKGWVKAEQIAQNLGLPFPMTAKVLQMLVHAHILDSVRGQQVVSGFASHQRKSGCLMSSWQLTVPNFLKGALWGCRHAMKRTLAQSTTVGFPSETNCVNSSARPLLPNCSRLGHLKSLNGSQKVSDPSEPKTSA